MEYDLEIRVKEWVSRLCVPELNGRDMKTIIAEMTGGAGERVFGLLVPLLSNSEAVVRSAACGALLHIDAHRAIELVLPLLVDAEDYVRWHACGCLHDLGDERAVDALVHVLQGDLDAQVRGTAAYALGGIGSPAAIPALLAAMESDHEVDILGHSPSSCAATALDDILGTEETHIKVSATTRKMRAGRPDLDKLRQLGEQRYQDWSGGGI